MMGARHWFRLGSLGGATLLTACTIGPRTPILVSPSDDPASEVEESNKDESDDDDFKLPQAEWVTNEGAASSPKKTPKSSDTQGERFDAGLATIELGQRPPWQRLDAVSGPTEAPPSAPARWRLHKSIWVGQGYLHQAAFSPDEKSVVTLSTQSGHIYHYDMAGKLISEIPLPGFKEFDVAAFAPMVELDDPQQLFLARPDGTSVVDLSSGKIEGLDETPPGTNIAHSGRPGLYGISLRKTTPQSGQLLLQWISGEVALRATCQHRPDGWALSPDGRYLAISYYPADRVEVIDLNERTLVSTIPLPKWGSSIDISKDGKWIALGGEKLQIATFPEGHVVAEDTKYDNNIDSVRFTPQGDLLLTSAYDGKARSYALPKDLEQTKALPPPQDLPHGGKANVYALGLTADGRSLVTSSGDKTLKIWKR